MKAFLKFLGIGALGAATFLLIFASAILYICWNANAPSSIGISLPPGTQILQQTDSHTGFFRTKGVAIMVAQVPPEHTDEFARCLQSRGFDYCWGGLTNSTRERLKGISNIEPILESTNALVLYRGETIAFIDELWSDYFTAVFDLDSGLLCCVEYDS